MTRPTRRAKARAVIARLDASIAAVRQCLDTPAPLAVTARVRAEPPATRRPVRVPRAARA